MKNLLCFTALMVMLPLAMAQEPDFKEVDCFLTDCSKWNDNENVLFGKLNVPENRELEGSPILSLAVVILKSESSKPEMDPIIYLDGGPGGNTLKMIDRFYNHYLRENRDIILMNFRGLGYSEPDFCKWLEGEIFNLIASDKSAEEMSQKKMQITAQCFEELLDRGVDLNQYNNRTVVQDLEDLRMALGIQEWNLYGISYGTRLAQTYMRDYPEGLRSALLDSPVPVDFPLPGSEIRSYRAALKDFFANCQKDNKCSAQFPDLESDFYRTIKTLKEEPFKIPFKHAPGGFFHVNYHDAHLTFHQLLYMRDYYPVLPWLVQALDRRDYRAFIPLIHFLHNRSMNISNAMYTLGVYHDYGLLTDFQKNADDYPKPDALAFFDSQQLIYEKMNYIELDSAEIFPFVNKVPTLILTGSTDPITPPLFGELVMDYLDNSLWLDFPGTGHAVSLGPDCAREITVAFFGNPIGNLDRGCIEEMATNPVKWVDRFYYNPSPGLFSFLLLQKSNTLIITALSGVSLFFLASIVWGLSARLSGRSNPSINVRKRNLFFRLSGLIFLVFIGLLAWAIYSTTTIQPILLMVGLVPWAIWIFFLSYFYLLGMALFFYWYLQSFYESNRAGRIFYGLGLLTLIGWSLILMKFGMFP